MKDKRTNVGYGKSMASSGGSGGMRGGRGGSSRMPNLVTSKTKQAERMDPFLRKLALERNELVPAKRRLGTIGRASASVKKMANKEIKSARKSDGSYGKSSYGRKSVNPGMSKAPTKPSSGKMSSRYAGKMKAMGKKGK